MYHTGRNSGSRTYTSEKKQGKNRKTAGVIGAFAVVCMLFLVIAAGYKILPYINNSEKKAVTGLFQMDMKCSPRRMMDI